MDMQVEVHIDTNDWTHLAKISYHCSWFHLSPNPNTIWSFWWNKFFDQCLSDQQIVEMLSWQFYLQTVFFARNLLGRSRWWTIFIFSFWCLTWGLKSGLTSNKPTHYLLGFNSTQIDVILLKAGIIWNQHSSGCHQHTTRNVLSFSNTN